MSKKTQSLTPLRFTRYHWFASSTELMNAPIDHPSTVLYGKQQYYTDCGRFIIWQADNKLWYNGPRMIATYVDEISRWNASGLCDAGFKTRREALQCLQQWCESEGIL